MTAKGGKRTLLIERKTREDRNEHQTEEAEEPHGYNQQWELSGWEMHQSYNHG